MRRFLIASAAIAFSQAALAQQPKIPETFTITVTVAEINTIGKALGAQPFNEVAALIGKLNQQVTEQSQPKAPAVPDKPADPEPPK